MSKQISLKASMQDIIARGPIVEWKFRDSITSDHGKYVIRFSLTFSDGTVLPKQIGGFETQRDAQDNKNEIIGLLARKEYIASQILTENFYDYWLNENMVKVRKIKYGTFVCYRNIIQNYILPIIKGKTMDAVTSDDLLKILDSMTSGLLSPAYGVFGSSFKYAKKHVLINKNPATSAISIKRKQVSKKEANERAAAANEQDGRGHQSKKRKYALTSEQAGQMLLIAKNKYPGLYLPLLIACTTGCRVSELIALRYRDVDYNKKVLHVTAQAGRPIDISGLEKGSRTKQRLDTKSRNGIRDLPVPDFVLDEIAASYKRWTQSPEAEGKDAGEVTIWHRADGTAYNRRSYKDDFNSLKKLYGLPDDFHWHDLRHVYATLMVHYQVNIKELAVVLGHSSGIFTMQHYVVPSQKVCEDVPEFEEIFLNAMPVKLEDDEIVLKETLIFEVPGFDEYSENLIKSSTIEAQKIAFGKESVAETLEIPYNNAV